MIFVLLFGGISGLQIDRAQMKIRKALIIYL